MCKLCETKPVYEFTNKRKICKTCFIRWFNKKVLYTIKKFGMIKKDDVIGYDVFGTQGRTTSRVARTCKQAPKNIQKNIFTGGNFRSVVLEDVLKYFESKAPVEVVRRSAYPKLRSEGARLPCKKKLDKIAIENTIDLESNKIVHELIKGNVKNLKEVIPMNGKIIKPLYLFLDKEVLLYAKLKGLTPKGVPPKSKTGGKFNKVKKDNQDEIDLFIKGLEKKHPEVKRAVVNSFLEVNIK